MKSVLFILLAAAAKAIAAPQGLIVAKGEADFKTNGSDSFTISASDQAVLNWSDFSIDAHETVEFIQPSFDAIAINRVLEANPSRIFGKLNANGQIILINPNGVLVGKESRIDTGSWIASTLDLNSDLFLKTGQLEFDGDSQNSVINEGSISARTGDLFLIGKNVQNKGTLAAVGSLAGTIGASSMKIEKGGLFVRYKGAPTDSQNPYANAFSVVEGKITNPGGKIYVLGETVGLSESAYLDVSHNTDPGEIFIGGDFQGKNTDLANAKWSFIEKGASIRADALLDGSGGRVIVWADRDTVFQGEISARGTSGGGFAEVSGKNMLHYEGLADLRDGQGNAGTLLLDPTQITIAGATAGVALGNCGFPGNTYASTVAVGNLATGILTAQLGVANTVVTTFDGSCGPFAGTGDIIVNSNIIPFTWGSGFTLTLNAARNISINASISETNVAFTAANRVVLTAVGNINIGGGATGIVGSRNGGTAVTCGGNLTLGPFFGQIGTSTATTCNGSITVNSGGSITLAGATHIGHGNLTSPAAGLITTATATITVNATGNINMTNGAGLNQHCKIGHGSAQLGIGNNQNGNILVTSGGSLTMVGVYSGSAATTIGHGPGFANARSITLSGDIDVQIANQLTMDARAAIGPLPTQTAIGHGSYFTLANATLIDGDISLCCGSDASLLGNAVISHRSADNNDQMGDTILADYDISIGGNLSLSNASTALASSPRIGLNYGQILTLNGILNLSVCGDVTLLSPLVGSTIGIGYMDTITTSATSANIVIGGNLIGTNLTCGLQICSQGNFNLAVGGNIAISMAAGNFDGFISSGRSSGPGVVPASTRIYTGGSLTLSSNGTSVLSIGVSPFIDSMGNFTSTTNLDVRAGGDIQWANGYFSVGVVQTLIPGSINIQAGHSFAAGEIWNGNNGPQLTSVCNQTLAPAFNLGCGNCVQFTSVSSAINPICGAFAIQGAGGPVQPVNFSTGAGQPLTLSSLCTTCSGGAPSALLIGSAAGNNITFANPIGAVDIGAFNEIDINQDITSSSSILITSCHDLNVNPGSDITSTGLGSPITLTADLDNSGMGNLNLLGGNITSNNGQICLSAGPGTFGCSSGNCFAGIPGLVLGSVASVNQTSGLITSGSGETLVVASGNITIDGLATSIGTTSGAISLTAGGSIDINEDIISTGGAITSISGQSTSVNGSIVSAAEEIRMIAGTDMSLNGTSTISSLNSSVTLVVDNQFPFLPFIGTGAFDMSCASQILSGVGQPVRIFTALSNSNAVCPAAQINGVTVSSVGYGLGALFEDTQYEVWCVYFGCPAPYPYPAMGSPFTVFYKNCLQRATQEAMIIIDQLLVSFHPYDEFPGWESKFTIAYNQIMTSPNESYMLRRRNLNLLNHSKTHTMLLPETGN